MSEKPISRTAPTRRNITRMRRYYGARRISTYTLREEHKTRMFLQRRSGAMYRTFLIAGRLALRDRLLRALTGEQP